MTEKEIQLLGFKRNDEKDLYDHSYHYYTYKIADGFGFISITNDEIKEGEEWYIEFIESNPTIRFTKFEEVQSLINLLEKRIVK